MALALRESGLDESATFITNVADDFEVGPYLVCPDTDAVLYALSGRFDEDRGWGVIGDRFGPAGPGAPDWFNLGELDLVTHRARRALLDSGSTLTEATGALLGAFPATASVVPATDDPLRTVVRCGGSWRSFQEWLVRDHASPVPDEVSYSGADEAQPTAPVLASLSTADLVVLAPSSPIASLMPILGLPGLREVLAARRATVVAVSSLVRRIEPSRDRDRHRANAREALLTAAGIGQSVPEVASLWADIAGTFVLDPADAIDETAIVNLGYSVVLAPTRADTPARRSALIDALVGVLAADPVTEMPPA